MPLSLGQPHFCSRSGIALCLANAPPTAHVPPCIVPVQAMAFLPPLPSLTGLQLESCQHLTAASLAALRCTPGVTTLMLIDLPGVDNAFLTQMCDGGGGDAGTPGGAGTPQGGTAGAADRAGGGRGPGAAASGAEGAGSGAGVLGGGGGLLPALKVLVLSKLDNLGDEGVQVRGSRGGGGASWRERLFVYVGLSLLTRPFY